MTTLYLRSTDGSDADNGTTWALAKATMAGIDAIDANGDTIYVSQAHSESTAAAVTYNFAGTGSTPTLILCGNDAAEPPTSLTTGGTIATTGASNISLRGQNVYCYGVTFSAGSGASSAIILIGSSSAVGVYRYDSCSFTLAGTGASSLIQIATDTVFTNCTFKFAGTAQGVGGSGGSRFHIRGGSIDAGGSLPANFFKTNGIGVALVDGFDFSNGSSTMNIASTSGTTNSTRIVLRNCKMPASWSGSLLASQSSNAQARVEMYNCDNGNTNYKVLVADYAGSLSVDTAVYQDAGATDGTTRISWKVVTTANSAEVSMPFKTPEIFAYVGSTGSKTATIEILYNSATNLKDDEIWIDVMYMGNASFPTGSFIDDYAGSIIAAGSDQATSSVTWTGDETGSWVRQSLSATFTVNQVGYIVARVYVAKVSTTVWIDPKVTVS